MYQTLLYAEADGIATITLNRPDRYNAFNNDMSFEFIDALKKVAKDPAVRVVVLTGAGKAFCSGQDLKDIAGQQNRSIADSVEQRYNPIMRLIYGTEKPFICRLNGVAAGAGAGIALACDYVVASQESSLLFAFARIGLVLDSASSYILPRLVGTRKAFELAALAETISISQALEWKMVNKVVALAELDAEVMAVAKKFAQAPTRAIGLIKKMLHKSYQSDLDGMLETEKHYQTIAGSTADYKEGVAAFNEKRAAVFTGK
jgi:2-(1,2-epoxy-1,2-dihydrophenyl)acetyl-CoA isomerase